MDPSDEYSARWERFHVQEQALQRRFKAIGNWRLLTGLLIAVFAWLVFAQHSIALWGLLLPILLFVALVIWHQNVTREWTIASRRTKFYHRGLARLQDKWAGTGSTGDQFRDPAHVYSEDLDLFGRGSLFELISQARTEAGQQCLASWLLQPASNSDALQRQDAVRELSARLDLREDLAVLADDLTKAINVNSLDVWGRAEAVKFPSYLRYVAPLLAIVGIGSIFGFLAGRIPLSAVVLVLLIDGLIIFSLRVKVRAVLQFIESTGREIKLFSKIIERLERERFSSALLQSMLRDLDAEGLPASNRIARLGRLVDWLDSADHLVVRLLRPLVLWQEQLAISFERWRSESGRRVGAWVKAVAQFEALSSLASLAYERPDWSTPDLLAAPEPIFEAQQMKHPLLPAAQCIPNDLRLDSQHRLLIVSGSNMSGKSTLLRSTGLNAVLAWAGAPVAATRLRISHLQTGASIRINDSLQDHRSRFFAEISRIRQVMDLTKAEEPVLFLLDEVLSGTNSHDRRLGAAAIVRELIRANAIGLITTHDLALAKIEGDLSGILNVHFEDSMQDNEMSFDYKLKPGVVTRSNALELMRAVGLKV